MSFIILNYSHILYHDNNFNRVNACLDSNTANQPSSFLRVTRVNLRHWHSALHQIRRKSTSWQNSMHISLLRAQYLTLTILVLLFPSNLLLSEPQLQNWNEQRSSLSVAATLTWASNEDWQITPTILCSILLIGCLGCTFLNCASSNFCK